MRYLILSGGGWKGAFQVPIALAAEKGDLGKFDGIYGTSVGSINGCLISAGKMETVGLPLWESIDDRNIINGIKGFLSPNIFGDSLFTLDPVRKLLKKNVKLADMKIKYGAGFVVRQTMKHHILTTEDISSDKELYDLVIASSAISFLMSPVKTKFDGIDDAILCDGGHRHVFPIPQIMPGDEIVAVSCSTLNKHNMDTKDIDGRIESLIWAAEIAINQAHSRDLEYFNALAKDGIKVTLYAPRDTFGGLLKSDKATIEARMSEGEYALRHPIILT